ncbi:MAG: aromatic ring-hydroxylating dioxygenase subunit alpha [Candidatus Eremiobacteraeota bacterium]|nr:aromatic ring-hydroxylating dioxygenase subunit alpha [Candidatus Eremiobacteraeota bacterium]
MASGTFNRLEPSLPRRAYWDPAFFAHEQRSIFGAQWVYCGRSELLPAPGDFRVADIGGESVILVRGDEGRLHAHINFCKHRGSRLLCGEGSTRGAIRCPYHAWAYALDGCLISAPFVEVEQLAQESRHLISGAVEEWGGFIFVHLPPAQEALADALGPISQRLARYPLAELRAGAVREYDVRANWKVLLENYNECYHCAGVHPELCRVVPAFKDHGGANLDWERGIPHRDGATTFTFSGTTARAPFPGLDDDERTRHKGELIYPNFLLSLSADHVAAFEVQPLDVDRTRVICTFLFHPDAMAAPSFDPTDAVDFWDVVNRQDWRICEAVQAGMHSRYFHHGFYAPMEDASLDIRRYIATHLGENALREDPS